MLSTRLLNVVVVGAGVYVCGRGTKEYGTVMPAILGWKKANALGKIYIVGQSRQGVGGARAKIKRLTEDAGVDASVTYFANGKKSGRKSYLEAFREIPKPACAIVVVPDNVHAEVASAAIKAGLHTLVVKPLTPTVGEAEGLIDLQQKSGVHCAVEFHKRLDLANIRLRDVIAEKRIGDPLYFIAEYSQRKNVPYRHFKKWVKETNVFQYLGVHYVDIIRFVTRAKPVRAMATGQKGWLASKGIPAYDSVQGVIEWKMPSGVMVTVFPFGSVILLRPSLREMIRTMPSEAVSLKRSGSKGSISRS